MDDFELIRIICTYIGLTWLVMVVVDEGFIMLFAYNFFTQNEIILESTSQLLLLILNVKFAYSPLVWTCFYNIITYSISSSIVSQVLSDLGLCSYLPSDVMISHIKSICWYLGHTNDLILSSSELYNSQNFEIFGVKKGEILAHQMFTIINNTEDYKFVFNTLHDFFSWYEGEHPSEDLFVYSYIDLLNYNRLTEQDCRLVFEKLAKLNLKI